MPWHAALLVFCGRLAERFPRNASFLAGIALFAAASTACALANSVETLVAFRLVQAAGAACSPPSLGLILASFPAERRGGAVIVWAAVGGLAAALGPLVGGLLSSPVGAGIFWSTCRLVCSHWWWAGSNCRGFPATTFLHRICGRPLGHRRYRHADSRDR